jgi:hypothetical protein
MSAANVRPIKAAKGGASQERREDEISRMNSALSDVRSTLFQAMGIVRMASSTISEPSYEKAETDEYPGAFVWTALDGAHEILCRVADRLMDSATLLAGEVPHGEY